jgi:hypothetical protein
MSADRYAQTLREIEAEDRQYGLRRVEPAITAPSPEDERERRIGAAVERERATREARRRLDAEERGPIVIPAIETLRDRLARPVSPTRWRIHGWQPRDSRVMLAAPAKAGKSTLVGGYVRSLVDGDPWLGREDVEPVAGRVVVLDTEMSAHQLDAWLRAQRIRHDDRVCVLPMRGRVSALDWLDDRTRGAWIGRLREVETSVLVLDCLRPVLDALGLDEHRDAGRYLVALDALLTEAGIGEALIVHHMGHQGERARGDSRLRDWPDVEWRLVRREDDPTGARYIAAYGRDVDVPESELGYESLTRRLTIAGGSRRDAAHRDALEAVLSVLDDAGEAQSGRAIEAALEDAEQPRAAIREALRMGVRTGVLVVTTGQRRARLYRRGATPVSQCATVRRECASAPASECAAPLIGGRTRALDSAETTNRASGALTDREEAANGYTL